MPAPADLIDRVDGRTARGALRKQRIARAVIRVIAEHGIEGLTHRRVAAAAEVPLGSTTYYFATLDDLLVSGLADAAERNIADVREWASRTPVDTPLIDRLVAFVQLLSGPDRSRFIAVHEIYLAAIRRHALRPTARKWADELVALFAPFTARRIEARILVYALDGIVIDALMQDTPPTPEQIRPLCRALVKGLNTTH
jgi:DNA-binding transcriptional regulator YbjK